MASTLCIVVEIDDVPEDSELRARIVERVESRLQYGVGWYDEEANVTHRVTVDRVLRIDGGDF